MSPKRIETILGQPIPFHKHLLTRKWLYRQQARLKISVLIDFMSNKSDIELQFEELLINY